MGNLSPNWPPNCSNLDPTWPQLGPNLALTWPNLAPTWPKLAPTWHNLARLGPNLAPTRPQLGPNWPPTWGSRGTLEMTFGHLVDFRGPDPSKSPLRAPKNPILVHFWSTFGRILIIFVVTWWSNFAQVSWREWSGRVWSGPACKRLYWCSPIRRSICVLQLGDDGGPFQPAQHALHALACLHACIIIFIVFIIICSRYHLHHHHVDYMVPVVASHLTSGPKMHMDQKCK